LLAAGAQIAITATTNRVYERARELDATGKNVVAIVADLTEEDRAQHIVDTVMQRSGRIDVLVNNAGIMSLAPLAKTLVDEWDRMIDINVKGVLHGIAAVLPVFERQKSGHFVNIASVAGLKVRSGNAVYAATKHAVRAISEGLRQEVGEGIRTTVISPGVVESELPRGSSDPETAAAVKELYRRQAIPADSVARAIAYAIEQPPEVDVNEIVLRPTVQEF